MIAALPELVEFARSKRGTGLSEAKANRGHSVENDTMMILIIP